MLKVGFWSVWFVSSDKVVGNKSEYGSFNLIKWLEFGWFHVIKWLVTR